MVCGDIDKNNNPRVVPGMGVTLSNMTAEGTWPPLWVKQRLRQINEIEMRAVLLAVQHWRKDIAGNSVQLLVDKSTIVLYIQKDGGTRSAILARLKKEI